MPNRLAQEKSPYLQQHADNPVDWYPWGNDAFARARAEEKPIFLSVGYSTCHWCHVMAHESFENVEAAELLNRNFVCIKVDREERPDVDRVYMAYVQALTGHGGWPLSVWLTPQLKPFYGGTYFPPDNRYGRPSFSSVLRSIAHAWQNDRGKLEEEGNRVIASLMEHRAATETASGDLTESAGDAFEKCFQHFYESFDPQNGGFGSAPKFPRASNLDFLFRVAAIQGMDTDAGAEAIKMATTTLQKMAEGGIHDHVGGGFHRYSVDQSWFVPHFEKMLYDQAQIAINYLTAFQVTGRETFLWLARDIFEYVRRDLTSKEGAFYSAEDADSLIAEGKSEHAEGAFYVWTLEQIHAAFPVSEESLHAKISSMADIFAFHFGLREEGNVPETLDPHHEFTGKNILMQRSSLLQTAKHFGIEPVVLSDRLHEALCKLKKARDLRPKPHRDDKIITAWNGLMISAFARATCVLLAKDLSDEVVPSGYEAEATLALESAIRAANFVRKELFDEKTGVLYRSFRGQRAEAKGFAEDYAFFIQGLLDLYDASFDSQWLDWAERLQSKMDELFWDATDGGYFGSNKDDDSIILRLKDDYDGAEPTASSVAAMNLLRLVPISSDGDSRRRQGIGTLNSLRRQWSTNPPALPQALCALEFAMTPQRQVVIAGNPESPEFRSLWRETQRSTGPRCTVLAADGGVGQTWLAARAPWLGHLAQRGGAATAYLCEHYTCREPVTTAADLRAQLSEVD